MFGPPPPRNWLQATPVGEDRSMHTPSVDSPPRTPEHRTAARATGVLALCSVLLLVLVAVEGHPLLTVDGDIADTTHRWAVDEPGVTHTFRILTDWVWDPWAMRIVAAVAVVWLVGRRHPTSATRPAAAPRALGAPPPFPAARRGHARPATVVCGLRRWLLHHYGAGRALWFTALALA